MRKLFCMFLILSIFYSIGCATTPEHTTNYGSIGMLAGSVKGKNGAILGSNIGSNVGFVVDTANMLISAGKGICSLFTKKKKKFVYKMTEDEYMENFYTGAEPLDNNTNDMDLIYAPSSKFFSFSDRGDSDIPTYSIKDQFNHFMAL